jgi:hypothetical protein
MANTFYRKLSRNVGTSSTAIGGYTVGTSVTAVIVGLTVCNTSGATVAVDITVKVAVYNTVDKCSTKSSKYYCI